MSEKEIVVGDNGGGDNNAETFFVLSILESDRDAIRKLALPPELLSASLAVIGVGGQLAHQLPDEYKGPLLWAGVSGAVVCLGVGTLYFSVDNGIKRVQEFVNNPSPWLEQSDILTRFQKLKIPELPIISDTIGQLWRSGNELRKKSQAICTKSQWERFFEWTTLGSEMNNREERYMQFREDITFLEWVYKNADRPEGIASILKSLAGIYINRIAESSGSLPAHALQKYNELSNIANLDLRTNRINWNAFDIRSVYRNIIESIRQEERRIEEKNQSAALGGAIVGGIIGYKIGHRKK